jgi:lipoprotein-anchoring transpeptidase ErfK/SrfK
MNRLSQVIAILMASTAALAAAERRLVVSIPERKLALIVDGEVRKVYPVSVGKASTPSPTGSFTIVTRVKDPAWYGPRVVVPPGPKNPLGPRWIGLSEKGYGVHGTNAPRSIGRAASHGCIRMRNRDVEELFEMVEAGDTVELIGEPDETVASLFGAPLQVAASAAGGAE